MNTAGELRVVDAERLDSGNIWFALDKPVTVKFADEAGVADPENHPGMNETSREWIIAFNSTSKTRVVQETFVHPAEGKALALTDDDRMRTVTHIEKEDPIRAFSIFTATVYEVGDDA